MSEFEAEPLKPDTVKRATLYQLIEELVLNEHARYLDEDCKVEPVCENPAKKI